MTLTSAWWCGSLLSTPLTPFQILAQPIQGLMKDPAAFKRAGTKLLALKAAMFRCLSSSIPKTLLFQRNLDVIIKRLT